MTLRARGQALIETAFALPLFVLAMFGVIWALQAGVLGERVQLLARYAGTVSSQSNPYDRYSFYATYAAAAGAPLAGKCPTPPDGLLSGGGPLQSPVAPTQQFWQPAGDTVSAPVCGRTVSGTAVLGYAKFAIAAQTNVPQYLQSIMGGTTAWSASLNQLQPADMGSLVGCYPELQNAFESSAKPPTTYGSATAIADLTLPTNGLTLSGSCGG